MKTALRAFAAGVFTGAALLYVLMWHMGAVAAPDLGVPSAAPRGAPPAAAPPARTGVPAPTNPFVRPPVAPAHPAPPDLLSLQGRGLAFPVVGFDLRRLRDNFAEMRGHRVHEAIDIPAPRGTPVVSVDDGVVRKLFVSARGGISVYVFDAGESYCYYYAHLDRYAEGLHENQHVRKGDRLGYVGTSGNAPPDVPHLHFTIFKLGPDKRWWEGTAINPFPLWALR